MTNYEKIKAMSIEEMAKLLESRFVCDECPPLEWLESEAENDD